MGYKTKGKTFDVWVTVDTSGKVPRVVVDVSDKDMNFSVDELELKGKVTEERKEELTNTIKNKKDLKEQFDKGTLKREKATFQRWWWSLMNEMQKASRVKDPVSGEERIDRQVLRDLKLRKLLIDWTLTDDEGKKIEIVRNKEGITETCFNTVVSEVDPLVLTSLLNKADLTLEWGLEERDVFTAATPTTTVKSSEEKKE